VLAAAAQGQGAQEFRGINHGVFTAALIDALHHSDINKDGVIMLSALVAHVQDLVPKLVKDPKEREALLRRGQVGGAQSAASDRTAKTSHSFEGCSERGSIGGNYFG